MLTVVTGPPCAGKSTYVRTHAGPDDVVVDYDLLAEALGSGDSHDHPPHIAHVARSAREAAIKTAVGYHHHGHRVWVIDTELPDRRRREYMRAGATIATVTAERDVLHDRARSRPPRWHRMIDQWLDDHPQATSTVGMREW